MDTSCLRLRFTPLLQNICKSDSKCCLEIVPEVSCIQNLDKIQWQHGDDSIEYTIPITYKVILKKKHKKQVPKINDDGTIKTYHSCVDLLKQSVTDMNVRSSDIIKVISDSVILSKHSENLENEIVETKYLNDAEKRSSNEAQITEYTGPPATSKSKYKTKEIKDEGTQFIDNSENSKGCHIKKIYIMDKITSTPYDLGNRLTSTDIMSCFGTLDCISSSAGKIDRKLSVTPICSINTYDNTPDHVKKRPFNFIVLRIQEPNLTTFNDNTKSKVPKENYGFEVIKEINNKSFETITNKSSERVLPEVRVAQFMNAVERELMPIKNTLNDMIQKCALLGFICRDNQNPMLFNYMSKCRNNTSYCKKESKSNRVVYSIVFDG